METEKPWQHVYATTDTPPGKSWVGVILTYPMNTRNNHLWRAITPIMRAHGRLQRHVFRLDSLFFDDYPRWVDADHAMYARLQAAYNGGDGFGRFHLYRLDGAGFVLARPPVKGVP